MKIDNDDFDLNALIIIMVATSLTTKLARERLAALKRFIPLRDRVRDKLNQRQELKTELLQSSEQLFAPITTATRDVKAATERAIYGDIPEEERRKKTPLIDTLQTIAATTGETQRGIQDLQTQREIDRLADIDISTPPEIAAKATPIPFMDKLTDGAIEKITDINLVKPEDYTKFGYFAAESYYNKDEFLKDEYKNKKIGKDTWTDWFYRINTNNPGNIMRDTLEFRSFRAGVDHHGLVRRGQTLKTPTKTPRQQQPKKIDFSPTKKPDSSKGATGSGYTGGSNPGLNPAVTCPENILGDITRLEVLIGGKRAGNNSKEIINEAADICRKLFQGGIMDIRTYRELIDELVNDDILDYSD